MNKYSRFCKPFEHHKLSKIFLEFSFLYAMLTLYLNTQISGPESSRCGETKVFDVYQ